MKQTYESLAAIAVFRELYDQGKDIYDVLAMFVKEMIIDEKMTSFSCTEITKKINEKNAFDLSEAVVKSALKRLNIPRKGGMYKIPETYEQIEYSELYYKQSQQNENLLKSLYKYIEQEKNMKLPETDKVKIKEQFIDYLMNEDVSDEYSLLISNYIMKVSVNSEYLAIINKIREGNLIYEGICYSGNLNEIGKWDTKLDIFLEQEVLFYIAGYNGEVHQEIYTEMLNYVKEINSNCKKSEPYIKLWYSEDVKIEIDLYFAAAEKIIENREIVDPSKKPMLYILKNAKSKSDVATTKAKFYTLLERNNIKIFKYDYYDQENHQYSIVDTEVYDEISQLNPREEDKYVQKCVDKLNYIEILRKNNNNGFDNVRYILLTANSVILKSAYSATMYKKGEVPKATDIDFLIDRFWFKLNKGFGKGATPKSLNVVSRASIILSFIAGDKISQLYNQIRDKYNNEEIDEKEVQNLIVMLRSCPAIPDEICESDVSEKLNELNDFDINMKLEEMRREELERISDKKRIKELETEIDNLKEDREKTKEYADSKIKKLCDDNNFLKKKIEKIEISIENENIKKEQKKKKLRKWLALLVSGLIVFFLLIYAFKLEKSVSGVLSVVLTIFFGIPDIKNFLAN